MKYKKGSGHSSRAAAYRSYSARVAAGYTNPLDPAGPRRNIRATHIDRFGYRYELAPVGHINSELEEDRAPTASLPVYRPSKRQMVEGCDACGIAHVHSNVYCSANPHCVRPANRLDPAHKFQAPVANLGIPETLYSLVPGRYPTYKALILEIHIIGVCLPTFVAFPTIYIYLTVLS